MRPLPRASRSLSKLSTRTQTTARTLKKELREGAQQLKDAFEDAVVPGHTWKTPPQVGNGFKADVKGMPAATGSKLNQLKQLALFGDFSARAAASKASGGRLPPEFVLGAGLRALKPNPPIQGEPTVHATYTSTIPGASPREVYQYFVDNPDAWFGAAGLKIRGGSGRLTDGARVFLEDSGPPPVWAPIEVRLDPSKHQVQINTLEGHPFRGVNTFHFVSHGAGGTRVDHRTQVQGSSPLIEAGKRMGSVQRQHDIWGFVHGHLYTALAER